MKMLSLFLALFSFTHLSLSALEYDETKPFSKQYTVVKKHYTPPANDNHQKGFYAEEQIAALFRGAGYFECPAKYSSFGDPDAVGTVYNHEENGLDGLFIKLGKDKKGKVTVRHIVVNESKFQSKGGSPRLGKMNCSTCSGGRGYEKTQQMSMRWIHNAVEWASRKGKSVCVSEEIKRQCTVICPLILDFLSKRGPKSVIRTASVMNAEGELHLYSLFDKLKPEQKSKADDVLKKLVAESIVAQMANMRI